MKKNILCLSSLFVIAISHAQQVGINTSTPHPSAVLDVVSPKGNQGFLLPRLTNDAVQTLSATAAEGLVVYNIDTHQFLGWNGSIWENLGYQEENTPPFFTALPIITSSNGKIIGTILTTNFTISDLDASDQGNLSQVITWQRAVDNQGTNMQVIAGASSSSYTTSLTDDQKYLRSCIKPISSSGSSPGVIKCAAWFGPIAIPKNDAPTASNVSITGSLITGSTLTGTYTYNDIDGDPEGASVYAWKMADNATGTNTLDIVGATSKTFNLTSAQLGKYIKYCVKPIATTGTASGIETCSDLKGPITAPLTTGLIAKENFGTASGGFTTLTAGGFGFTASNNGYFVNDAGKYPSTQRSVSGYAFVTSNKTIELVSDNIDATSFSNNIEFSMRIASFSGTVGNGFDQGDYVSVYIDNGSGTFAEHMNFTASNISSNLKWDFNQAGFFTKSYADPIQNNVISSTANAKGGFIITGIPNTIKRIKIVISNNKADEQLIIDEISLTAK